MKKYILYIILSIVCSVNVHAQSTEMIEIFSEPKEVPYYEGGMGKMCDYVLSNLNMDSIVFDGSKVFVGFTIDTLGNTHNHRILRGSIGKSGDEALINACKLLHFNPAIGYDNKPQNSEYSFAIQFEKEDKPVKWWQIWKRKRKCQ